MPAQYFSWKVLLTAGLLTITPLSLVSVQGCGEGRSGGATGGSTSGGDTSGSGTTGGTASGGSSSDDVSSQVRAKRRQNAYGADDRTGSHGAGSTGSMTSSGSTGTSGAGSTGSAPSSR